MASLVRRGSCLCKAITFSITGAPARMIQCNCLGCQKSSGSALLSNVLYKRDQYKVESGKDKIREYIDKDTKSGSPIERAFCGDCGSNLYIHSTNPQNVDNLVVCSGSIDGAYEWFNPQSELFGHRRHGWIPELKRKPKGNSKI